MKIDLKNKILTILLFSILSTAGCSVYHINSQDISTDYYPSKPSAQDIVYLEDVDQPHEIIGYITVNTERNQRISDVIEKMKREAAILGADAITNIQSDATGKWRKLPAQQLVGNGYVRANFTATAVLFK